MVCIHATVQCLVKEICYLFLKKSNNTHNNLKPTKKSVVLAKSKLTYTRRVMFVNKNYVIIIIFKNT